MQCFFIAQGMPSQPPSSPEDERNFEAADCLYWAALISVLVNNILDVYMLLTYCRIESQELSQPEGGWMVGIPKNQKILAEIKVTLEFDGDRSDRDWSAGLTALVPSVWQVLITQSNRLKIVYRA